jgi:hypothetical protein
MLTVNRLKLPAKLRRSLACTNSIENMMGKSQGSHARQLALSCDAVVLFERAPDLVSKLSIFFRSPGRPSLGL